MTLQYQFINTAQGKIAFVDSQGSGFPIVFIHGNSCSSEVFKKQLPHFSQKYRTVTIDLPGHGKSDNANRSAYNIPAYAKLLNEITTALQLTHFAVVGFSLGGNIALQWTQLTNRIKGVMMVSSAPMKYSDEAFKAYPPCEGNYAGYPNQLTDAQAKQYMETCGVDTKDPAAYFMIRDAMRTDGSARSNMVESVIAGNGIDETKIISELSIPLALVVGTNDQCLGISYISELPYQNLWHNKIQFIPNAKHAIFLHQADLLNQILDKFLLEI